MNYLGTLSPPGVNNLVFLIEKHEHNYLLFFIVYYVIVMLVSERAIKEHNQCNDFYCSHSHRHYLASQNNTLNYGSWCQPLRHLNKWVTFSLSEQILIYKCISAMTLLLAKSTCNALWVREETIKNTNLRFRVSTYIMLGSKYDFRKYF